MVNERIIPWNGKMDPDNDTMVTGLTAHHNNNNELHNQTYPTYVFSITYYIPSQVAVESAASLHHQIQDASLWCRGGRLHHTPSRCS